METTIMKKGLYRVSTLALLALIALSASNLAYTQTYSVLYNFGRKGGDATQSQNALVQGADGALYGASTYGGAYAYGSVFRLTPAGKVTVLYSFCREFYLSCPDGDMPNALTPLPDESFLGTTEGSTGLGGPSLGTIFRITQGGALTNLYTFTGGTDGAIPLLPPIQGADGNFYGVSTEAGNEPAQYGCGTAYRLSTAASVKFTLLHQFHSAKEGCHPTSLVLGKDGNFYGTAQAGGTFNNGTVFRMTPSGHVTLLHSLEEAIDGFAPYSLILGSDGNFYGTAPGVHGIGGTVFKITPGGTETVYSMSLTYGTYPLGLAQATDGNFYGNAGEGGTSHDNFCASSGGCGTLFEVTPTGDFTELYDFDFTTGFAPRTPIQHTNGVLYGVTYGGGLYEDDNGGGGLYDYDCGIDYCGVAYSLKNDLKPFAALVPFEAKVGASVEILGQGFAPSTTVRFNGTRATVKVTSGTRLLATVPAGATTGPVTVTTSSGTLTSNREFVVAP